MKAINIKVGDIVRTHKYINDKTSHATNEPKKMVLQWKVIALYPYGVLCVRRTTKGIIREFFYYNLFRTGECIWRRV